MPPACRTWIDGRKRDDDAIIDGCPNREASRPPVHHPDHQYITGGAAPERLAEAPLPVRPGTDGGGLSDHVFAIMQPWRQSPGGVGASWPGIERIAASGFAQLWGSMRSFHFRTRNTRLHSLIPLR